MGTASPLTQKVNNNSTTDNIVGTNIADWLFNKGTLDAEKVKQVKFEAINTGKEIEQLLVEKGYVNEETLYQAKSEIYKIPYVDIASLNISQETLQKISQDVAKKNLAIAFDEDPSSVSVAMADPLDLQRVKFLSALIGKRIKPHFANPSTLKTIIDTRYGAQVGEEVAEAMEEVEGVVDIDSSSMGATDDLSAQISNAPVSKIVNMILEYAVKFKASDIHIEPREGKLSIRYRINGVMSEKLTLPRKLIPPIVSRVKILSDLKIDEHRIPQDGRFQIKVENRLIDIRVSVVPAIYGEKVVMRLLERGGNIFPLEKTGIRGSGYKVYREAIEKTQGIILITGPTGSGKTQTLASSLQILNKPDVNIMTLENPVEIRVDGVNQVQVNPEIGLTFAKGLRAFLRQDPDIIMVGEIRDQETAELAIQASLTGHLVLATLHTNSAAGALPRLFDMGVQDYLLASTINVVVGQRLVRTLCEKCKQSYIAPPEVVKQLQAVLGTIQGFDILKVAGDPDKVELFKSPGCPQCNNSGYQGRTGIFEVMQVSEVISQMIIANKTSQEIEKQAKSEGMITMVQDGFMKALEGQTTIEEVLRVQN